jgi:hypothetical protein
LRAVGLAGFAATCVIGLVIFPISTSSQPRGNGSTLNDVSAVMDTGYRRGRYRKVRPQSRYLSATRPRQYRPNYRYFGADRDRYFGVGPGSYECYGYDCNW